MTIDYELPLAPELVIRAAHASPEDAARQVIVFPGAPRLA